jgi:hypothetical protein
MTKAMHLVRKGGTHSTGRNKRPAAAAPAVSYPAGFFTALIREHNWPPRWQPAEVHTPRQHEALVKAAQAGRSAKELGVGFHSAGARLALKGGDEFLARVARR